MDTKYLFSLRNLYQMQLCRNRNHYQKPQGSQVEKLLKHWKTLLMNGKN